MGISDEIKGDGNAINMPYSQYQWRRFDQQQADLYHKRMYIMYGFRHNT